LLETGSSRRRCDHKKGVCPARCDMPAHKVCGGYNSILSGNTCTPKCDSGYSVDVNSEPLASLTCTNGALSTPANYDCWTNAVSGKLTAKVLKAVNLKDADWFAGHSDAYVLTCLNNQYCTSYRTPTVKDNKNPVWDSYNEFDFTITSREDKLFLKVYDEDDNTADDNLGQDKIDLRKVIQQGGPITYEVDLKGSGKLFVQLKFDLPTNWR